MEQQRVTEKRDRFFIFYRGIMALGGLLFLMAAATGIWRIALTRGVLMPRIPEWLPPHGHLMLGGFLAAVIMFERIIALRIHRLIWVPYAYVISALFLPTGSRAALVVHLIALAGWIVHRWMAYRQFGKYEKPLVESVAYVTLSAALTHPGGLIASPLVALTALAFPVVTILVERLELSLNFRKNGARALLWSLIVWCGLWILSSRIAVPHIRWMGVATLVIAAGCIRYDQTLWVKTSAFQLHSFLRRALTVAYVWFILSALAMVAASYLPGAVMKDILFHLLGLGFIFTMILAHAPLILPAAIGKLPPFSVPVIPFAIFQLWTVVRILSDLMVANSIRIWMSAGWITGILHLVTFIYYMALIVRRLRPAGEAVS
jgi:hypothetical protein